jgi:hypothetical protein
MIAPPVTSDRFNTNVSSTSSVASARIGTSIVSDVMPLVNVRAPLVVV